MLLVDLASYLLQAPTLCDDRATLNQHGGKHEIAIHLVSPAHLRIHLSQPVRAISNNLSSDQQGNRNRRGNRGAP